MTKVAIVSGGGRGIGAATCRKLAESFGGIGVIDRDRGPAEQVAEELGRTGAVAEVGVVDVTDAEAVATTVDRLAARLGGLDAVVAAAGNMDGGELGELTPAAWSSVLDVHLTGSFTVVRAALPALRRSPSPSVVLTSSVAARGIAGHANYGAAKAGIIGLMRSLALELGPGRYQGQRRGARFHRYPDDPGTCRPRIPNLGGVRGGGRCQVSAQKDRASGGSGFGGRLSG